MDFQEHFGRLVRRTTYGVVFGLVAWYLIFLFGGELMPFKLFVVGGGVVGFISAVFEWALRERYGKPAN